MSEFLENPNMKYVGVLLNNKIRQLKFYYIQKKGRKNSTPKAISNITSSPDGAIVLLDKSNEG